MQRRQRQAQRRRQRRWRWGLSGGFLLTALLLIGGITAQRSAPTTSNPLEAMENLFIGPRVHYGLQTAWRTQLAGRSERVSIALYSAQTGQLYTRTNAADHQFHMASTVKVAILAGILRQEKGHLTAQEKALATRMIENSDNAATNLLFEDYLGGQAGLQATFAAFGMTHSTAHKAWGLSTTTPADQVRLLNQIYFSSDQLNDPSRAYLRYLMAHVATDQQWGISAGSDSFALKNGWLPYGKDQWIINSIGYIDGPGANDYTIAIYTDHNPSMASGKQLVEQLAQVTRQAMRRLDD
ncbi:serine hydrolase [Limosilactobacillus ingluviei]|uniref:serine hydrolase n=1 Tax=Limosilactobacillus ingluviei TaxID=148604 RepID=UPI00265E0BEA|nr:serine hydrolase [Limosilactobacillus ingluviei]